MPAYTYPPSRMGTAHAGPPPVTYTDPHEPILTPAPPLLSFPLGSREGVGVAPSRLSTPDNDAGLGLFGIVPKRSSYARISKFKHLFARKGDYICSYNGPLRSPQECISHPSMYLFSDPLDPLHRYIEEEERRKKKRRKKKERKKERRKKNEILAKNANDT